jgi:MFS family permease
MLQALAIILIIGIACTVATLIVSFVAIWLSSDDDENKGYTAAVWIALGFSTATVFFLILGGLVGTAGPRVAEDKIRGLGLGVEGRVSAAAGKLWLAMAWVGVLLMAVVLGYWARRARVLRKLRKEEKEKEEEDEEEAEGDSRSSRRSSRSSRSSRSFHTARRSRSRRSSHRSRHRCRSCRR